MPEIYLPISVANRIKTHEYVKALNTEGLKDNPICPKCERVALRDEGWTDQKIGHCPHCGYKGKMNTTLKEYAEQRLYK